MVNTNYILLSLGAVLALSHSASAFLFGRWGAETETPAPPQYYYHKRLLQGPMPFYSMNNMQDPRALPAIPIAVPLQAKLAPSSIQNVQLVPCLCPVQQDYGFDPQPQENPYLSHFQQQAQSLPQQQQQQVTQKQTSRK